MFPLNWNIPFIRKNGSRTTLGAITGDIAGIEEEVAENSMQIQTLTNQVRDMNNVLGAKNLLPLTKRTGGTQSGVTFTVNDNGSITVNGTATNGIGMNETVNKIFLGIIPKGEYLISCKKDKTTVAQAYYTITNGVSNTPVEEDMVLSLNSDTTLNMWIYVSANVTYDNVTFYPMIRLASITDDTYEPYAKTNQQLTELTSQLALSVIPGATGSVFDISCNTPYERALVITPYSIGSLAYWSDTYHYIPLVTNPAITVTASNESSTGLTLTFTDSVVSVAIMSLTNRNDIWSGTKVS